MQDDICESLNISLPTAYTDFWEELAKTSYSGTCKIDFWHDPKAIVDMTRRYRAGYGVNPPWPRNLLFIGDDGAACPYALDVDTGMVIHLDHGNIDRAYLSKPTPLVEWIDVLKRDIKDIEGERTDPPTTKEIAVCIAAVGTVAALLGYMVSRILGM